MRYNYGKYKDVVSYFKKNMPPAYKVSVRRMYGLSSDAVGDIELKEKDGVKKFYIRITRKIGNDLAILSFLHEWAHAISWQEGDKLGRNDHGPEWGVAYSRVWRKFEDYLTS